MLSLRVSRDKRGYDHIYLLLETRRKGRTVSRLVYGGRWPSPMRIGQPPLDEATRRTLEQAYPEITFDWVALQRMLQQALSAPRPSMAPGPGGRARRPGAGAGAPESGPGGMRPGSRGGPPAARPGAVAPRRPSTPYEPPEAAVIADIPEAPGVIEIAELEEAASIGLTPELDVPPEAAPELEVEEEVEQTFVVCSTPSEFQAQSGEPPSEVLQTSRERDDNRDAEDEDDGEDAGDEDAGDDVAVAASPDQPASTTPSAPGEAAPSVPSSAARRRRRRRRRGRRPDHPGDPSV